MTFWTLILHVSSNFKAQPTLAQTLLLQTWAEPFVFKNSISLQRYVFLSLLGILDGFLKIVYTFIGKNCIIISKRNINLFRVKLRNILPDGEDNLIIGSIFLNF